MSSPLLKLPNELLFAVVAHLDLESTILLAGTCKTLQSTLDCHEYWLKRLHSRGFGTPSRPERVEVKSHVNKLLTHCKTCEVCLLEWKASQESILPEEIDSITVHRYFFRLRPIAIFYDNEVDGLGCSVYLTESSKRTSPLEAHPVFESRLITNIPVSKSRCTIERSYLAPEDRQPDEPQYIFGLNLDEVWDVEPIECSLMENPFGITYSDLLRTCIQRLESYEESLGPKTELEFCDVREPGHLIVAISTL